MQNREKQNIFTDYNILDKDKLPNNFPSLINKETIESRENYNSLNIQYDDNFKSASKIYKNTNPSNSATPIKLFQGPNLISPFKEGPDIYNNSPIKMDMDFGNALGGILSSAKKSALFDDNNNNNNNKEIIQGKKINFNEDVSNLNLIQNRKNSNFYMSELKEENKPSFFLSPIKANNNDKETNYQNVVPATGNPQNKMNLPPNGSMYTLSPNANENINNKIINGGSQDKTNINTNGNYQDYSNMNYNRKNSKNVTCTCTRTQCQKKYCACYARGKPCIGCDCKGCLNNQRDKNTIYPEGGEIYNNNNQKEEEININRNICQDSKSHSIVCNCTKSKCMKKYCECYKMNIPCGSLCRCIDCQNKNNPNIYPNLNNNNSDKSMNLVNNLDDNKNIMNDSQKSNMQNDNIERIKEISKSFSIISMEIYINNKKLIIQEREIDLNKSKINLNTTPKMTNKKRARGKNENSNLRTCPTTVSASRRKKRGYSQVNSNVKTKKLLIN